MIYENYFSLQQRPFSIAPNPDFLYAHGQYQEALAVLEYGMLHRGGFTLLTGEVGTGKTTLCKHLLSSIPENTEVALILHPQLDRIELLQLICREFDLRITADAKESDLIETLTEFLLSVYSKGGYSLLVIDEAQHLDPSVLELIRLLTNLETHSDKLLQIILLGQPELKKRLQQYDLRQLNQRFTARFHLKPLSVYQVRQYIQHRLQVAGSAGGLFSYGSSWLLHRLTGGIPRLINLVADRSLMGAYAEQHNRVPMHVVFKAAKEVLPQKEKKTFKLFVPVTFALFVMVFFQLGYLNKEALLANVNSLYSGSILSVAGNHSGLAEGALECKDMQKCWQGMIPQALIGFSSEPALVSINGQWQTWQKGFVDGPLILTRIHWVAPFTFSSAIKKGDSHEAISWVRGVLQQTDMPALIESDFQNWQVIKPDGSGDQIVNSEQFYDVWLVDAVKEFQRDNHLLVDGILGKQTFISLSLWQEKLERLN